MLQVIFFVIWIVSYCDYISCLLRVTKKDKDEACVAILWHLLICTSVVEDVGKRKWGMTVENRLCTICDGFTDIQKEMLSTPTYKLRKEKRSGVLVSPDDVTVVAAVDKEPVFHIPPFESDLSEPDKSNNPWKGKAPKRPARISVAMPPDDWLCQKLEKLSLQKVSHHVHKILQV